MKNKYLLIYLLNLVLISYQKQMSLARDPTRRLLRSRWAQPWRTIRKPHWWWNGRWAAWMKTHRVLDAAWAARAPPVRRWRSPRTRGARARQNPTWAARASLAHCPPCPRARAALRCGTLARAASRGGSPSSCSSRAALRCWRGASARLPRSCACTPGAVGSQILCSVHQYLNYIRTLFYFFVSLFIHLFLSPLLEYGNPSQPFIQQSIHSSIHPPNHLSNHSATIHDLSKIYIWLIHDLSILATIYS